ncbi:uncharacterized protein LOC114929581 isoform X1 [Nylanderia fulva]|uniref:uncharacterized protein LOC114929581 isoform X1 n=2 Tax=Nylanderia fulva TaxID=613905 RepID=UPI0010FB1013|nr:uncharacterized protein LOC114929581 isoform X1 [Nylanderia fulva]XP_029156983.1 uncharacterized protein LOC114929581 isoform X1 [Nylanderia fulva]XP_029156984.1 uncharacterized protein LOC114929581 isoform X1 [Nylanderia fulva]XP_029156986.1 uncharacterized protein LOC114929581 isoform X1 [Nylanderia fulva]
MIHSFFEENDAWCYWVVSVGALLSFLGLIAACICSCRRNENKNEFLGLAGMVTLNNSETDGFNRIPTLNVSQVVTQDIIDGAKRTTTGANRSLPDIPKDKSKEHEDVVSSISPGIYEITETMRDHSELYATVQDAVQEQISERETQEINQQNSLIQDASHQYARFTSLSDNIEHPYAQLQNFQKTEVNQVNRNNVNQVTNNENSSTSTSQLGGNPIAPPRTRRSSSHNSLLNSELHSDIQAANAISGSIQANQDLPYMTPPLLILLPHSSQSQHNSVQQHFSGDSQDSKGYTSISVREPLANIIAQTKATYRPNQSTRPIIDSHYTTVSDDSDEMYAAIDEQDKVYTSGSETYAQIQPMMSEVQRHAQNEQTTFSQPLLRTEETYPAPQPPSVDSLRYVAHAHSRQASSSSANSSIIINPGSPKPEKRQANSPLPPPPETTAEGYAIVDKKNKGDDRSRSSLSMGKSLEDMYAKVMKKRKEVEEQQNDTHSNSNNLLHSEANSYRKLSLEVSRASWCSHESVEIQKKEPDLTYYSVTSNNKSNFHVDNDNNTLRLPKVDTDAVHSKIDHEYETVNSNSSKRNSIVRGDTHSDSSYNMLRSQCSRDIDFQNTSKNSTDVYSASFKHRQISNASSEDPGYEKVRLRRRVELDQDTDSEPNYESMPHDTVEPNYASVCQPSDSDTDPNYESVSHGDPNYESVRYMSVVQNKEPPYEQVNNMLDTNADGYEKIKDKKTSVNYKNVDLNLSLEQINNRGDTDDGQYIQV